MLRDVRGVQFGGGWTGVDFAGDDGRKIIYASFIVDTDFLGHRVYLQLRSGLGRLKASNVLLLLLAGGHGVVLA